LSATLNNNFKSYLSIAFLLLGLVLIVFCKFDSTQMLGVVERIAGFACFFGLADSLPDCGRFTGTISSPESESLQSDCRNSLSDPELL
jgi:hypothetical protein